MDASSAFLEIVSGRSRDPLSRVLRGVLTCCEPLYGGAIRIRNAAYDSRNLSVQSADAPVISIGNLTTGGTGKTPVVAWIVNVLRDLGASPGILSRGYRSLDGVENDEKLLLDRLCPRVPHIQNRDRVAGSRQAVQDHGCGVLVLDDGFQHRRLDRQLDIVLIDAVNPWGFGHLLPRGLLREPPAALHRADVVLMTRTDQVNESDASQIEGSIRRHTSATILRSEFAPTGLINADGVRQPLELLSQRRGAAFCGIGNPEGFRRTLAAVAGTALDSAGSIPLRVFPDHHHYGEADLCGLTEYARSSGAEGLLTTAKDLVKIPRSELAGIPLWAVEIELQLADDARLTDHLQSLVPGHDRAVA